MTIQKIIMISALTAIVSTPTIFSMQSHKTAEEKIVQSLSKKAEKIFTIDRQLNGTPTPNTPLYINLTEQKLQTTTFLQLPRFQALVINQYIRLTGKKNLSLADITIEMNLARNAITQIAPLSFKGYNITLLTVDEINLFDEEVNKLALNHEVTILWE